MQNVYLTRLQKHASPVSLETGYINRPRPLSKGQLSVEPQFHTSVHVKQLQNSRERAVAPSRLLQTLAMILDPSDGARREILSFDTRSTLFLGILPGVRTVPSNCTSSLLDWSGSGFFYISISLVFQFVRCSPEFFPSARGDSRHGRKETPEKLRQLNPLQDLPIAKYGVGPSLPNGGLGRRLFISISISPSFGKAGWRHRKM